MDRRLIASLGFVLILATACPPTPPFVPPPPPSLSPTAVGNRAHCSGSSAAVTLSPGATGQFQGTCTNTGSVTWVRGSQTQAFLATCCPEGSTVTFSTWGVTGGRYGTQSTDAVAPGQMGLFVFNLTVPLGMASGTYYSYGVVVNANNQLVSENAVIFVVVVP